MNRRNLSSRELINSLLNEIEVDMGYHILDKTFSNYYFVMESDEPDTVCHFHIKEIPRFSVSEYGIYADLIKLKH